IYRHQAAQFPRRWEILKAVGKHELAPPKATDWPAIKGDWKKVTQFIATKQYKELTVRVRIFNSFFQYFSDFLLNFLMLSSTKRRWLTVFLNPFGSSAQHGAAT
ncbi:hypothetical protein OESDEN_15985, partial [Oesophagostomum dentatum]